MRSSPLLSACVAIFAATAWRLPAQPDASPTLAPEAGFASPPDAARAHVFWHWMNGNVTAEGITLDLEAMQRVGIRGAQIYNAAPSIPAGPAKFMGPEWRRLSRFALQEAQRLHLDVGFHNCAGWSSSGGPWVPVDQSMMELTWSETPAAGGQTYDGTLAEPNKRKGFYRDVACLAIPAGSPGAQFLREVAPTVTLSFPGQDGKKVIDGNFLTVVTGPSPSREHPQTVTFAFARPFLAQTLEITPGTNYGGHGGFLESSADGNAFTKICDFQIPDMGNAQSYLSQGFPPVTARYFRLVFNRSDVRKTPLTLAEIDLSPEFKLRDWRAKAGFIRENGPPADTRTPLPGQAIDPSQIQILTSLLAADGHLRWEAPPGAWLLLRIGYTTKDKFNKPAGPEAVGYECDKMSQKALETFWGGMMRTLLTDNADLVGRSFRYVVLDSFEVGTQNYTAALPEEFARRCGYSLIPYLPALTGRVVGSIDLTERFLWDYRRVVADLWKENYFDHLNTLADQSGLEFMGQPYGNGNFDSVSAGTGMDDPSTEFWVGQPRNDLRHTNVTSAAHLSGRRMVFSESFTAHEEDGSWKNSPGSLKALGDLGFCDGVNAIIFHTYAHQPWADARPGMTMGPFGIHFNRGNTWWESIGPWMDYLARCQYLLRRGRTCVDVTEFSGENSPNNGGPLLRCPGYHVDFIDRNYLPSLMVADGVLETASGMHYRLLVLPPEPRGLSLPMLRAVRRLVHEGATVIGAKPSRTPSLQGYPASEREAEAIAAEVWGKDPAPEAGGHRFGLGRVFADQSALSVLSHELGVPPDCSSDQGEPRTGSFEYIHRIDDGTDYYFLSNQSKAPMDREFRFRVTGRQPELWNPMDGHIADATRFRLGPGQTAVRLSLPVAGSMFVVFRKALLPSAGRQPEPPAETSAAKSLRLDGPWTVTFQEKGGPASTFPFDRLISWPDYPDPVVRYFSGTAVYETSFTLPAMVAVDGTPPTVRLDLGRVEVLAQVELNGKPLGILWTQPFQCDLTPALVPGRNTLKIRITNLWPNRLIGDQEKGDPRKWAANGAPLEWPAKLDADQWPAYSQGLHWMTWRHFKKGDPLLPSGLLGPVQILIDAPRPVPVPPPAAADH